MEQFTRDELKILMYVVRTRLRNQARRPGKIINGVDVQYEAVRELADLYEKLERMRLTT